jgi:peptide/nickel transport system ATP-binding protein
MRLIPTIREDKKMTQNNNLLLEVKDLRIHFFTDEGVVKAVDGVDMRLTRGRTLCLVGESGCGKSVACRAFLKIIHRPGRVVSGEMLYYRRRQDNQVDILDIAKMEPKGSQIRSIRGKEISMIFQEPMTSLSMMHTVGDQIVEAILLHFKISKQEARERAIDMLKRVGLPKADRIIDEYPFRLSGGMRQRVMIAMALSCNPSMLIADEPTTALDVTTQAQITALIRELQAQFDMAVLYITHDLGVVAEVADDVAVMYLGKIVEFSDVRTIFHNPQHPYTKALLRSIPKIAINREELDPIRGMVPSPFRRPKGCTFNPRCAFAMDKCKEIEPKPVFVGPNHSVRCLLYDEES